LCEFYSIPETPQRPISLYYSQYAGFSLKRFITQAFKSGSGNPFVLLLKMLSPALYPVGVIIDFFGDRIHHIFLIKSE
jgi:hypothetical protein